MIEYKTRLILKNKEYMLSFYIESCNRKNQITVDSRYLRMNQHTSEIILIINYL